MAKSVEENFYEKCKSIGIYSLDKASDYERAKLIAPNYGIRPEYVRDAFESGLYGEEINRRAQTAKKEAEKNAAKYRQDVEEQQKLKITALCGRERVIAHLNNQLERLKWKLEVAESNTQAVWDMSSMAMESVRGSSGPHWATLGGIADGIAGPGAGIAVALEAQAQQQKEEASAQAKRQEIANVTANAMLAGFEKETELEIAIEEIEKKIEKAKLFLEDSRTSYEVMTLMNITDVKALPNTITVKVNLPQNLLIFDDVEAVVDGSFFVHVYQAKEYVGSTRVSLPENGLKGGYHSLTAKTSLGLNGNENIFIELEPEALCLMEQYRF